MENQIYFSEFTAIILSLIVAFIPTGVALFKNNPYVVGIVIANVMVVFIPFFSGIGGGWFAWSIVLLAAIYLPLDKQKREVEDIPLSKAGSIVRKKGSEWDKK